MALPASPPITLSAIQTEFGAGSLSATGTTALGRTNCNMLEFLGLSSSSILLTINDADLSGGGSYYFGFDSGTDGRSYLNAQMGSLSPTTSSLWAGNITALYSYQPESSNSNGTYMHFNPSQFYTGPYYLTYRGQTYEFLPTSANDSYSWFNANDMIFNAYGVGTVKITKTAPRETLTMTVGGYGDSVSGNYGFSAGAYGTLSPTTTTSSLWTGNIIGLIHSYDNSGGADGGYNDIELVFGTAQSYTGRYIIEIVGGLTVSAAWAGGLGTNFQDPTGYPGTGSFVFGTSGTKTIRISKG